MHNKYASCLLCEQIVYIYKTYSNKSSDRFFDKYRAVVKNDIILCIACYHEVFVYKHITMIANPNSL
jgi:hypothetical protein